MNESKTIKDLVKDKMAHFSFARDGELWYEIKESNFQFPVPFADVEGATFLAEHKAITLMRWVRKHVYRLIKAELDAARRYHERNS